MPTIKYLKKQGYENIKKIKGIGLCALRRFAFTTGLCYGLCDSGYKGRYCYENKKDAQDALEVWDGIGDPQDEFWVKHKGETEYTNPKNETEII